MSPTNHDDVRTWTWRTPSLRVTVIAAACVLAAACSDLGLPTSGDAEARFSTNSCPTCLTPEETAQLEAAIANLSNSTRPECAGAGSGLAWMLWNGDLTVDVLAPAGVYGYATGGQIFISPLGFSSGRLENTLSHEYAHAALGYHDPGTPGYSSGEDSSAFGNTCEGTY